MSNRYLPCTYFDEICKINAYGVRDTSTGAIRIACLPTMEAALTWAGKLNIDEDNGIDTSAPAPEASKWHKDSKLDYVPDPAYKPPQTRVRYRFGDKSPSQAGVPGTPGKASALPKQPRAPKASAEAKNAFAAAFGVAKAITPQASAPA